MRLNNETIKELIGVALFLVVIGYVATNLMVSMDNRVGQDNRVANSVVISDIAK